MIKNVALLRRLFEILQSMATNKTLPAKQRLVAIGVLSESAFHEYKNCDAIIDLAYSELLSVIQDDNIALALRVEAIVLMLMLFKHYASLLPKDKVAVRDDIRHLCLRKIRYSLEHEKHDIEGWLSCIDFLIAFQTDFPHDLTYENIFKSFNQQLIDIAHDKNQTIKNKIFSINLLFDAMYPTFHTLRRSSFELSFMRDNLTLIANNFRNLWFSPTLFFTPFDI